MNRLGSFFAANVDARDMVMLAGLGLLAIGLFQVFVPAAFIVPGAVLTYVAIWRVSAPAQPGADD